MCGLGRGWISRRRRATDGRGRMAVVGSRLYRFDGHNRESCVGGGIEWLDVSSVWQHAESGTTALRSGWAWEEITYQEGEGPQARSEAGLVSVTTEQGRKYLLAIGSVGYGCSGG